MVFMLEGIQGPADHWDRNGSGACPQPKKGKKLKLGTDCLSECRELNFASSFVGTGRKQDSVQALS